MRLTPQQLIRIVLDVRSHHRHSGLNLDDPNVVRDLVLREHPDIRGVYPPPPYDQMIHDYLPASWLQPLTMRTTSRRHRPAAIRPLTDHPLEPLPPTQAPQARWEAGRPSDAYAPFQPPPDPAEQILADLDLLRGDPMAAMTYVCCRANNVDNRESMSWARLSSQLFQLLQMAPAAIRADTRAEEARQRDVGFAVTTTPGVPQPPAPGPPPGVDPLTVRSQLEALEQRQGALH